MSEPYEVLHEQCPLELAAFARLLQEENIRSYLEIGSKHGGSLWHVAKALPRGSRIVSVDLPWGRQESKANLQACMLQLGQMGYDTHLILGDSTDPAIVKQAGKLAPFDAVFIDANHTEAYVRRDWANYGPMGRLIGFHDIGYRPNGRPQSKQFPIEAPRVWDEIKREYAWIEIKMHHTKQDNGIGVLWRI